MVVEQCEEHKGVPCPYPESTYWKIFNQISTV
jgi:hypothetical protein